MGFKALASQLAAPAPQNQASQIQHMPQDARVHLAMVDFCSSQHGVQLALSMFEPTTTTPNKHFNNVLEAC